MCSAKKTGDCIFNAISLSSMLLLWLPCPLCCHHVDRSDMLSYCAFKVVTGPSAG